MQGPRIRKDPAITLLNLAPLLKSSDASVDLIWKCFVLYDTGFIFYNIILIQFLSFLFLPSIEIVSIYMFYT